MLSLSPISLAELLQAAAAACVAARLFQFGAVRRQPALVVYLCFIAVYLFALSRAAPASAVYFWLFVIGNVLNWGIAAQVVRETFTLAFQEYPGIRTAGRWTTYGAIAAAEAISLIVTSLSWNGGQKGRSGLFYLQIVNQAAVFALGAVIVSVVVLLSRYPLHLHRNTYISSYFFSAVFLSEAGAMLFDRLSAHLYSASVDAAQVGFAAFCFFGWAVALSPQKDAGPTRVTFESPEEHDLLRQLDALNALLSRAARR